MNKGLRQSLIAMAAFATANLICFGHLIVPGIVLVGVGVYLTEKYIWG